MPQGRGAGGLLGAARGGQQQRPVLGPGDGGQTARRGRLAILAGMLVVPVLRPFEDLADAPAGAGPGGPQLALPAVEGAALLGAPQPVGLLGVCGVLRPQAPRAGLEGVPGGFGELCVALGRPGEAGQHGGPEGAQPGVVVADGELVEGPLPVGAGGCVAAQQPQRGVLLPAVALSCRVGGQVAEHGEREPGAHLGLFGGAQQVGGVEEVGGDVVEPGVQLPVQTGVVQGAVFDLPVAPGVVQDAVP